MTYKNKIDASPVVPYTSSSLGEDLDNDFEDINDVLFKNGPVSFSEIDNAPTSVLAGAVYISDKTYDTVVSVSKLKFKVGSGTTIGDDRTIYPYTVNSSGEVTGIITPLTFTPIVDETFEFDVDFSLAVGDRVAIISDDLLASSYYSINGTGFKGSGSSYSPKIKELGSTFDNLSTFATGAIGFGWEGVTPVESIVTESYVNALNYLYGKKLNTIGDSMAKGHTLTEDQVWDYLIADRNSMDLINYATNGVYLSYNGATPETSTIATYSAMRDDADYIVVFAGTNDAANNVTIGNNTSVDQTEFKGALNLLCDGLQNKYPDKKIMFITNYEIFSSYVDYADAVIEICALYSIPVFDTQKLSGINWSNTTQKAILRLDDSFHLSVDGMMYISTKYENFMRQL